MFFKEVIHDTDNENLKMLYPIPIWIQYFDDHDFHDRLFDYGKQYWMFNKKEWVKNYQNK